MVETVVTVERTTTTQPAPGAAISNPPPVIKLNLDYYKSIPGYVKIAEFIIGIICMACVSPAPNSAASFFLFVIVVSFIGTTLWIFAYLLGIREALNVAINWIFTELVNTACCALFYFIASVVQLATWSGISSNFFSTGAQIAGGVFGIFNTLVYGFGTYLLFLQHRSGSTY